MSRFFLSFEEGYDRPGLRCGRMGYKMISAPFWSLSDDGLLFLYFLCVVLVELISITLLFVLYRGSGGW